MCIAFQEAIANLPLVLFISGAISSGLTKKIVGKIGTKVMPRDSWDEPFVNYEIVVKQLINGRDKLVTGKTYGVATFMQTMETL